jgi:adenosylhomocysteine nucleosidase
MKVLITFALENEFAPWRKFRRFQRVSERAYTAKAGLVDVRVVLTGVGRVAVERTIAQAFADRPDVCIISGLSGALNPLYRPGDIIVARTVTDIRGTRSIRGDAELIQRAETSGATLVNRLLVSERVIATTAQKRSLASSGDAVDMESIYILAAAGRGEIRAVAIRAISDGAESTLPLDFDHVFNEHGAVSIPKVIGQVVRQPSRLGGLIRLAQQSERSATSLARFLDSYVQVLAAGRLPEIARVEVVAT